MRSITTGTLDAREVSLYYTVRGAGPFLLIIQGGSGNADGSESLANELAGSFKVVTYDRRGLSRSRLTGTEGCDIAGHAADAARLIASLSPEPGFLFGSSMGGLIGLELAARHGEFVRRAVVHEPPAYRLLKGAEQDEALRSHMEVLETFQREGIPAATKLMIARSGVDFNDREPDVTPPALAAADTQAAAQRFADLQYFFNWDVPAVNRYEPDLAALTAAKSKIVPAVGAGSTSTRPYRSTIALADALGVPAVEFPGGHTGYILRPKGTAALLSVFFEEVGDGANAVEIIP